MAELLAVDGLTVVGQGRRIVDEVSFAVGRGETLGLVGESGSGKTVTCRALLRLLPSTNLKIAGGSVKFEGTDLLKLETEAMRRIRGRRIGMIFQNPASHLDPVMSIGRQIAESLRFHRRAGPRDASRAAVDILRQVGIPSPASRADDFPHQFSGGMRQRAMIALALACEPDLLIADEPTTALDVTVQAQILRLLLDLRDRRGLSIILITHDLGIVAQTCDAIAVMYAGRLCERGATRDVLTRPLHPYTAKLVACRPSAAVPGRMLVNIPGQPPLPSAFPTGCRFHPRCDKAMELCHNVAPVMVEAERGRAAACHLVSNPGMR
ncbi:MAG: ABC transporter ATP-binding protein [Pseudomonadota bacterium]|nr:ABC transporter ATP-binding protein [Pseudomonadota bacterium]